MHTLSVQEESKRVMIKCNKRLEFRFVNEWLYDPNQKCKHS
jgi:hypothetical protein